MKIGEWVRASGTPGETVHHYECEGLLPTADAGHRTW